MMEKLVLMNGFVVECKTFRNGKCITLQQFLIKLRI